MILLSSSDFFLECWMRICKEKRIRKLSVCFSMLRIHSEFGLGLRDSRCAGFYNMLWLWSMCLLKNLELSLGIPSGMNLKPVCSMNNISWKLSDIILQGILSILSLETWYIKQQNQSVPSILNRVIEHNSEGELQRKKFQSVRNTISWLFTKFFTVRNLEI